MHPYEDAVARVAAALNNESGSSIGDPVKKDYRVQFERKELGEAFELAKQLTRLKMHPTTTVSHDDRTGDPSGAEVRLYTVSDQKQLLVATEPHLDPERKLALERLVRSRGPIPAVVHDRIEVALSEGRKPYQIAKRMNALDVIDGRGGGDWTPQKVNKAHATYVKQRRRRRR